MFVAVSFWDLEVILKGDVQRQKLFCSTDVIKVPNFALSLRIGVWEFAATEGSLQPISFFI